MQLKFRLPLAIFATVLVIVSSLHAQDDDEDEEEFATMGFYSRSPSAVSMALKMTKGPTVTFGNLGTVTRPFDQSNGALTGRGYDDGEVFADELRPAGTVRPNGTNYSEVSGTGDAAVPLYPNDTDGRYYVYAAGTTPSTSTMVGDFLSYRDGRTRSWNYDNASQISTAKPGYVAFNIYSAQTQGQSFETNGSYSGGIELGMARNLKNFGKRVVLSIHASVSLAGINNSRTGDVVSTLQTYRDYYRYYPYPADGGAPVTPISADGIPLDHLYTGPSFTTDPITGRIIETTTSIDQNPDEHSDELDGPDVIVRGRWKIRGAYFTVKVGPQLTAMITRSIGVSAGLGVAGSFAGTTYSAEESFEAPEIDTAISIPELSDSKNMLLAGYYANIDATWSLNDRTGLFAGASYDNLGEYDQSVGGRTAKIDLSATSGVRGGLNIKF